MIMYRKRYDITIYSITCPISGMPIYVGKTTDIATRASIHISGFGNTKIAKYCKYLKSIGLQPIVNVIESFYYDGIDYKIDYHSEAMEVYWIQQFKAWGFRLLNHHHYVKPSMRSYSYFRY